jgi:adenosylcobinamide kinase / adenosylcobinamide-phosphate guanylyltransferase
MGQLTLLLGGARSGKSTLAEILAAQRGDRVLYVATAIAFDAEMKLRIENHQKQRPDSWITVESPTGVAAAAQKHIDKVEIVLLDCLTLLVNNLFMNFSEDPDHPDETQFSTALDVEVSALLQTIETSPADWIIVSNEVGLGLVPPYPLGRVYRDLLGRANQKLAARADEIYFMIAGLAVPLHEVALKLDE